MILIVDMNCTTLGFYEFVLPICDIVGPAKEYVIQHYTEIDTTGYQKIILSGAALKDTGYLEHIELFEWVKTCDVPVLGICAGMQVISLVFDSRLRTCQEIGMTEINPVKKNMLFSSKFTAYELHNFGIGPSDDFDIFAVSQKCVQGIKHREKEIYGVLFHPEVRNKDILRTFIY
jgi:GMP synthase (glutamine-hydrolysing)